MRTLPALILTLFALPVLADPSAHYGRGPSRELLRAGHHLEQATAQLYRDVQVERGRSEATSRARDLAEAARDFNRLVTRNAPPRRLHEAFHRVEQRQQRLARQLVNVRLFRRPGPVMVGLRDVDRAAQHVERALDRRYYAYRDDGRHDPRHGPDERREPWPYR